MYTNIDTDAALKALETFLTINTHLFPNLPVAPLVEALSLLVRHNVFQFGDTFWKQLTGTAMGSPPAPTYANATFATHGATFLHKYAEFLLLYKRYIDDILGIWRKHSDPIIDAQMWAEFKADVNA